MPFQTFLPTVLVIDDDRAITTYMRKNFHENTTLGVLIANDMSDAKKILDDKALSIDTIVADLNFEKPYQCPEEGLIGGIDILDYGKRVRPNADRYVFSIWSERDEEHDQAKMLNLEIKAWLNKMFYDPRDTEEAPWNKIYLEQLTKRIINNKELERKFKELEFKDRKLEYIADFINQLNPPRITFLQELYTEEYALQKPIKILSTVQEDGSVNVKELSIGILTDGIGDTIEEALEDIAAKIIDQKNMLDVEPSENLLEFTQLVKERIDIHVIKG